VTKHVDFFASANYNLLHGTKTYDVTRHQNIWCWSSI